VDTRAVGGEENDNVFGIRPGIRVTINVRVRVWVGIRVRV